MPKPRKKTSKRQTLHQQHKVKKKIAEHHRQQRKDAKKSIVDGKRKFLKKDPGIPNLYPFKEELLQRFEARKAQLEDERKAAREARIEQSRKARLENKPSSMEQMLVDAEKRGNAFNYDMEEDDEKHAQMYDLKDGSKRAYYREFKKIVEGSDVILEVLDARDPMGCRCPDVEQKIISKHPNKKIIFILNKIDLIPKDNVEDWLKYLRNEFPAIAFKCSTQDQRKNLGHSSISTSNASAKALESSECLGADTLLQLLKNYSRNSGMKTALTVGIIGYPNVGKSSLINSLKRSRSVGVGSTPGFTKTVQEIQLDKSIKLLDSPGIVFGSSGRKDESDSDIVLRNAVKVEQIVDPISPVELILKRCKKDQLMSQYNLHDFSTVQEFLIQIAQKRGKLKKGGVPNIHAAAKTILQDWNGGKIPFYTIPPKVKKGVHLGAEIVKEYSKGFDLEEVFKNEKNAVIAGLPTKDLSSMMQIESGQTYSSDMLDDEDEDEYEEEEEEGEMEEDDGEDEMEEEGEEEEEEESMTSVQASKVKSVKQNLSDESDKHNPQRNRNLKKELKKNKKRARKTESNDDSYDFTEHFGEDDSDLELEDV